MIAGRATLGAVLADVERLSPLLAPRPLRPSQLPVRIAVARWLLRARHAAVPMSRSVRPVPEPGILAEQPRPVLTRTTAEDIVQASS